MKKDAESLKSQKQQLLKTISKSGKPLFTDKEVDDMIKGLEKQADKFEKAANEKRDTANSILNELKELDKKGNI